MKAHLIRIDALDAGGSALTLRLSSIDHHALCHQDGATWWPGIARLPALRYDFFGGDFRGAITAPQATFSAAIEGWPGFAGARFASARFRLWSGTLGDDFADFDLRFDGLITREPQVERGIATFEAGPDDAWLDKPLLSLFAGTGGLEGPDEMEGTAKPLALGTLRFAAGQQIDAVDNVWCVSGHGSVQAVTAVYDRVASLGASTGNYADLASLLAASIPNGGWATCHGEGLVRLGAPPDGKLSFDIEGDNAGAAGFVELPGEVIGRIAELAGGTTDSANLAALDAACPWPLAMDVLSQTTARQAIQEIADSLGAVAGITWTGTLFVQPIAFGTAGVALASDGSSLPPVGEVAAQAVAAPFWRLATRAEPTWVVHDFGEVATGYNYRGEWSATRVYRLDDMVVMPDGRVWVYTAASPSSGNEPADGSAYWSEDLSGGNSNFYQAEPASPKINDKMYGAGNEPFLFLGGDFTFGGEAILFAGVAITVPGWVSVRDQTLQQTSEALQSLDDDGLLTIFEKKAIAIPRNGEFQSAYDSVIAQASSLGLSSAPEIAAATAAWNAYVAYRDSISPAWNDTTQASEFAREGWDALIADVVDTIEDAKAIMPGGAVDVAVGSASVPSGAVFAFAMNSAPAGYLECDGSAVSRDTYAALYAAIGDTFGAGDGSTTFNLPDLRAEFVRGWDNGRGEDSGRTFGSWQADEFKSHTHDFTYGSGGSSIYSADPDSGSSTTSTEATGGDETRPRNVALLYAIKT